MNAKVKQETTTHEDSQESKAQGRQEDKRHRESDNKVKQEIPTQD